MSNPFDNKIKESLENFEMPYDANAWAALEKQLPQGGGASGSGQLGWKIAALFAVVATIATSVWYLNSDDELKQADAVVIEQVETTKEQTVVDESSTKSTEPVAVAEESKEVARSEKSEIADSNEVVEAAIESKVDTKNTDGETAAKADDSITPNDEKKTTLPVDKPAHAQVNTKPLVASFITSAFTVCVGEQVGFINESSDMKAKMTWDFGDGTTSSDLNPSHAFVIAGNYSVTLKTENNSKVGAKTVNITVNQSPMATLEASRKVDGYAIPLYHFETILEPTETATWTFSDGSVVNGISTDHLFRNAGKSNVTLTVRNDFGCSSSKSQGFENRKAFDLIAPTDFTADGDGLNETFMPGALPDMGIAFEMTILDQKGQKVYNTSNPLESWNGQLNNYGAKLDAGIYIWTVILKEEIASNKTYRGTIKLNR